MLLGRVIGTVWATRKDEKLEGMRLMIVEATDLAGKPLGGFVIAVDAVQAGAGELVLVAQGSSARQTTLTTGKPVDAVIMAIVENLEVVPAKELDASFRSRREAIDARLARQPEL